MQPSPLGDKLARWQHRRLSLRCGACGWTATPLVGLLAARLGTCTTLAEAARRLACRECGSPLMVLGLVGAAAAVPEAERSPGIPVFGLTPNAAAHSSPLWAGSIHRGPCYVSALDERRARLYAANAFADPAAPRMASGLLPASPWMLPALVAAERAVGSVCDLAVAEGTIATSDRSGDARGALQVVAQGGA